MVQLLLKRRIGNASFESGIFQVRAMYLRALVLLKETVTVVLQ